MCGRFVDPNLRNTEFDLSQIRITPLPRRFNIKPTEPVYVSRGEGLELARWGLVPGWHRGALSDWRASTFNARLEEAAEKPSFRGPFRHGRCLIPAGGYYEWTGTRSPKQPHLFMGAGNEATLWFAGLVSHWQELLTCTILTRAANESVAPIHDRMPVILNGGERVIWMAGGPARDLGAGVRLNHHPVARFGLRDEGESLIEPLD